MPNVATAEFTYTRPDLDVQFAWEGGTYIDVFVIGAESPFTCINVWDYSTGCASILPDQNVFEAHCDEWLEEN